MYELRAYRLLPFRLPPPPSSVESSIRPASQSKPTSLQAARKVQPSLHRASHPLTSGSVLVLLVSLVFLTMYGLSKCMICSTRHMGFDATVA